MNIHSIEKGNKNCKGGIPLSVDWGAKDLFYSKNVLLGANSRVSLEKYKWYNPVRYTHTLMLKSLPLRMQGTSTGTALGLHCLLTQAWFPHHKAQENRKLFLIAVRQEKLSQGKAALLPTVFYNPSSNMGIVTCGFM